MQQAQDCKKLKRNTVSILGQIKNKATLINETTQALLPTITCKEYLQNYNKGI